MRFNIAHIKKFKLAREIEANTHKYLAVNPNQERVALERVVCNKLVEKAQKQLNAEARKTNSKPDTVKDLYGYFGNKEIDFYRVDL